MLTREEAREAIGQTAFGEDGETLGKVSGVFLDDETGQPAFVTVNLGLSGSNDTFVPITSATLGPDGVRVPFSKDQVKDSPDVYVDEGHVDLYEERRLYEYYGMTHSTISDGAPEESEGEAS